MNQATSGPAAIFQMMQAHHVTAALAAGIELGVFEAVHAGAREASAIAQKIQCPERTTRILADALAALGVLTKAGSTFGLSPLAEAHLVPGKPQYLGGLAGLFASPTMWQGMSHLGAAVKAGGSVLPEHAETPRHPFWETFAKSTVPMSMPAAMAMSGLLKDWLPTRSNPTLLDVAAGSGTYGFTLVKDFASLQATLLDWPNVLPETRQWAKRLGADEKRVHYIEGNLFEVPFGGPYDVVLLSHVFHHFEPAVCQTLMAKCASALKPGGRIVIHDFLTDGDNPAARMFAVTMVGWTKKGEAFASADYAGWCQGAGLKGFRVLPIDGIPSSLVVAEK